jgi:hypothetical protein
VRRLLCALCCLVMLAAACGSRTEPDREVRERPPPPPRPMPEEPEPDPVAPLTGLPFDDDSVLERPVVAIKIDNVEQARPPQGLQFADVMITELVEAGFTRFIALYQSRDAGVVGPVRSARIVDTWILPAFDPVFAFSGAADPTYDALADSGLRTYVDDDRDQRAEVGFIRQDDRPRPHNLYVPSDRLWELADDLPAPSQAWTYDEETPEDRPVTSARITFSTRSTAQWDWSDGRWLRSQDGGPHTVTSGEQLAADNVIILRDPSHDASGNAVPGQDLFGAGDATFLRDGVATDGRWRKPGPEQHFSWFDGDGESFDLAPGTTWIELVPEAAAVELEG